MRSEKLHLVNYIGGMLTGSDYIYFVSYQGLSVKDFEEFRNKLAAAGGSCHVLKNTLIKKAAADCGIESLAKADLKDSTALVYGKGEVSEIAKMIIDFSKAHEAFAAKGGYVEGALLSVADFNAIASLPSKDVMRAMLLGVLQAPARNLACLLNAKAATILNVLNAYKEKREE